jgi:hypothetical protein
MNKTLWSSSVAIAATLSIGTASQPAQALTFNYDDNIVTLDSTSVGKDFTIFFYGGLVGDDDLTPDPFPTSGLQAKAIFLLNSFDGSNANFSITVENNSGANVTASRISILGFNVDTPAGEGTFDWDSSDPDGTVKGEGVTPSIFPNGPLDICFKGGGGAGNCAAGGGGGVLQGDSFTFSPTLSFFLPGVTSFDLKDFYVRYQSIDGTFGGVTVIDASGVGNPGVVPTPALLPGLVGIGVAALRKKQQGSVEEEA